ncbi:hypothetical protein FPOAC2_05173 [Fusarium poae]
MKLAHTCRYQSHENRKHVDNINLLMYLCIQSIKHDDKVTMSSTGWCAKTLTHVGSKNDWTTELRHRTPGPGCRIWASIGASIATQPTLQSTSEKPTVNHSS